MSVLALILVVLFTVFAALAVGNYIYLLGSNECGEEAYTAGFRDGLRSFSATADVDLPEPVCDCDEQLVEQLVEQPGWVKVSG